MLVDMHTSGLVVPPLLALHELAKESVLWIVCCIEAADQQLLDDRLVAALRAICRCV
jgi:hypothetical protein